MLPRTLAYRRRRESASRRPGRLETAGAGDLEPATLCSIRVVLRTSLQLTAVHTAVRPIGPQSELARFSKWIPLLKLWALRGLMKTPVFGRQRHKTRPAYQMW